MEISLEEKEAIEYIKDIKNWWWNNSPDRIYAINKTDIEQFDIALNYIDKLQKENTELKEELDYYKQKENQEFDERDYWEE